jgi:hypothetical protein
MIRKVSFLGRVVYIHTERPLIYYSCTGANFDIFLNANPYLMKMKGAVIAIAAIPPRIDIAGPTPRL